MTDFDRLLEQLKYFLEKGAVGEDDKVELTVAQAKVLVAGITALLERQALWLKQ